MRFPRSSGVLCHVSSLPGEFGIGDLGESSHQFIDFLADAGQSIWQVLPLTPPAEGNSPYSAYSAHAGNPLLISPRLLVVDGWLSESDLAGAPADETDHVDFPAVAAAKARWFRIAFDRFTDQADDRWRVTLAKFADSHASWLDDFSQFEAFADHFDSLDWSTWPVELVRCGNAARAELAQQLQREIEFSKFKQFLFDRQFRQLRTHATDRGVRLMGDMPIFVAHESADVWANQQFFELKPDGKPKWVAGVPPDYFSKTGQRWGNPQYRWDTIAADHYQWWTRRFATALSQFDLLRIDHFRGFEAYWEIDAAAKTAVGGRWRPGPGAAPFLAAEKSLGTLPFIAEDLGMITQAVHDLRDQLGYPGMRVMQFGFDSVDDDFHRPSAYPAGCVAYTGTHDNDTLMGWLGGRPERNGSPDPLADALNRTGDDRDSPVQWRLMREVFASLADTAIVPVQDLLGLDNAARMNVPGLAKGNWGWRLKPGQLTTDIADRLREMTRSTDRLQ